MPNTWLSYLRKYHADHPHLSYKEAMQEAGAKYRRQRGGAADYGPAYTARKKKAQEKYKDYGIFSKHLKVHKELNPDAPFYVNPLAEGLNFLGLGKKHRKKGRGIKSTAENLLTGVLVGAPIAHAAYSAYKKWRGGNRRRGGYKLPDIYDRQLTSTVPIGQREAIAQKLRDHDNNKIPCYMRPTGCGRGGKRRKHRQRGGCTIGECPSSTTGRFKLQPIRNPRI